MIKNIEQLNQEELLYVKDVIRKYLEECEQDDIFVDKSVKKVNERLKKNDRNIEKIQRKLERLQASDDDFLTILGILCSGILSGFLCYKEITYVIGTLAVFGSGAILSFIANDVVNNLKERSQMNMYKDLDEIEDIKEESEILKSLKNEILDCKSYHKKLRDFTNQ